MTNITQVLENLKRIDKKISSRVELMKVHTDLLKEMSTLSRDSTEYQELDKRRQLVWTRINI